MATGAPAAAEAMDYQLTQVVVPLEEARLAFSRVDSYGRIPLVVIPTRQFRLVNTLTIAGACVLVGGFVLNAITLDAWTLLPIGLVGVALIALGLVRSLLVPVPEAVNALLMRGGKYQRTLSGGTAFVAPWIAVSHLVTQREVPFEVLVVDAPTQDSVRMRLEALLTFSIVEPRNFVFNISADDFDQVLQASCQAALRQHIRGITVSDVFNLTDQSTQELREAISQDTESYGVTINKIKLTFAQAPADFQLTHEAQQLAVLMRAEQAEKQALAERRQSDADALERQRLLAKMERQREKLRMQVERAETQRKVAEATAEAEELRLRRLDDRLRNYPSAAEWDLDAARLGVARALAGNSRAVLSIGAADDISRVLVMQETRRDDVPNLTVVQLPDERGSATPSPDGNNSHDEPV